MKSNKGNTFVSLATTISISTLLMLSAMRMMNNTSSVQRRLAGAQEIDILESTVEMLLSSEKECSAFLSALSVPFNPVGQKNEVDLTRITLGSSVLAQTGKPLDKDVTIKRIYLRHFPDTSSTQVSIEISPGIFATRLQWFAELNIQTEYGVRKSVFPRKLSFPVLVYTNPLSSQVLTGCASTSAPAKTSSGGAVSAGFPIGSPWSLSVPVPPGSPTPPSGPGIPQNYRVPDDKTLMVLSAVGASCTIDRTIVGMSATWLDQGDSWFMSPRPILYLGSGLHPFTGAGCDFRGLLIKRGIYPAGTVIGGMTDSATAYSYPVPAKKVLIFGSVWNATTISWGGGCHVNNIPFPGSIGLLGFILGFGGKQQPSMNPMYGFEAGSTVTFGSMKNGNNSYTKCYFAATLADAP